MGRNSDNHPAFFAVYNMETTEIISFYQVSLIYATLALLLGSEPVIIWFPIILTNQLLIINSYGAVRVL